MTKKIRIENADMSNYKVIVEVWERAVLKGQPDVLLETIPLLSPCSMTHDGCYITSTRYLIVKEMD